MKHISLCILLLFIVSCGVSSRLYKPQIVKINGDYIHTQTKIIFPEIIDDFKRKEITSFDERNDNIGVTYILSDEYSFGEFTIYIYPAGDATESRLIQQYFASLQSIANIADKEIDAIQEVLPYQKDGYKVNGLFAQIDDEKVKTSLTLFECGKWFLKYRITTNSQRPDYMELLRSNLLKKFDPIEIVKKYPLKSKSKIYFAPALLQDSLSLGTVMGCALNRLKWINENVDSLERCSGFPNLYLESHSIPMKEMINWYEENKNKFHNKSLGNNYILSIKNIIQSGFLNEFLMDQHSMLLITPAENMDFRFEDYYKWKENNLSDFNFNAHYFVLEYTE